MSRRSRKSLLALGGFSGIMVLIAASLIGAAKSAPGYYRPPKLDSPEFEASAKRMEDKLIELRNLAAEAQAALARGDVENKRYLLTITQDELNAFLLKWTELNALSGRMEQFVRSPMVAFEPGRIIFAAEATIGPIDSVASLHTSVRKEGDQLSIDIDRVRAGRVTVPHAIWEPQVERVLAALQQRLPGWQEQAKFDRSGAANDALAKTIGARLLVAVFNSQPGDPRVIIPVSGSRGVAVRLDEVTVERWQIRLSLVPLDATGRSDLLADVKAQD